MLFRKVVEEALNVCPDCQHHFRVVGPIADLTIGRPRQL